MRAFLPPSHLRSLTLRPAVTLLLFAFFAAPAPTLAQDQASAEHEALAVRAEEAYHNLEIDEAIQLIDEALGACAMQCEAHERARLFVLRGIFVHGQPNGGDEAREDFKRALRLDHEASVPTMLSTPAIEALFSEARESVPPPLEESPRAPSELPEDARLSCSLDTDCAIGESCENGHCVPAPSTTSEPAPRAWDRVFLELGYSLTMATARSNMIAASTPTLHSPGDDPQRDSILENDSYILPGTHGCEADEGEYCVRVSEGLAVFAHGLHIGGGVYLTDRVALALRLRYSPGGGQGALSNFLVGARVHYRLTEPRREGFHAAIFGGVMAGQIQVRPKQKPTVEGADIDRPWAATGLGGLEVGAKLGYRFTPNFGVFASPELYTLFPDFSFGLQATLGLDVTFGTVGGEPKPEPEPAVEEAVDSDGDGIADPEDQCPDQPEDYDGFEDDDGCPEPDNDGDGIPDSADRCPNQPEDFDGYQDEDGCPDPDNDGDGIPDAEDECPDEAGPALNQGCPFPDRDEDGIPDRFDNCPDEAGPPEHMGCPAPQLVQIEEDRLRILDSIYFRRNGHVIESRSFNLLNQLASVIANHPDIVHVRIEGHTDSTGRRSHNLRLSQRRAESVRNYLIQRGKIDPQRLSAHGYGPDQPIFPEASNESEHAANRRVEFVTIRAEDLDDGRETEPADD